MKLTKSEELYNRRPGPAELLALCLRYWLSYKLTGDIRQLNRANHRIITADDWSVELQLVGAFFAVELELYDTAAELLERIASYRGYFKANSPVFYETYLFLMTLMGIRTGKERVAGKHSKLLADYSDTAAGALMQGWLRLEGADGDTEPWEYFTDSFASGNRSVFLFERVYSLLLSGAPLAVHAQASGGLLLAFINWSISQRLDITGIIDAYMDEVLNAAGKAAFGTLESIYAAYPNERLLASICAGYIDRSDYSETAYKFYREAETRQLDIPRLQRALVYSAFHGRFHGRTDEISRYTMERFLKDGFADADERLKAYVYHTILTAKKLRDFIPEHSNAILQFSAYCLENGLTGRHYNSIYKYYLEYEDPTGTPDGENPELDTPASPLARIAADILRDSIFTYRVTVSNPLVRNIWIIEKEKRDASVYEVHESETVVRASSELFSYVCFGEGVRHIIDARIKVTKMVENADIGLYARYYAMGFETPDILIALARHCLSQEELNADSAQVLQSAAQVKGISTAFKMQIFARLGNYFYDTNAANQARAYYAEVDENYLNDRYIERMLTVFINTGEYRKAAWLIAKKEHCISERGLFQAMKTIARDAPDCAEYIAPAAYGLLLRSWYDKTLIDVVIKHYKAAQAEWEALNNALNRLSATEAGLDEVILSNAAWIRKPNAEAQKVFARMYRNDPDNEPVGIFAYYLTFELLVNDMKPEYDTISVLESIFRKHNDSLLAYALSNMYLVHGLTTMHSDEVLSWALGFMERDGFILPAFKRNQDKKNSTPYIEKYQTFTYKSLPGKDVRLYYKPGGETEYRVMQMEYLRFGIYYTIVPHFYGEKLTYYFSEEMPTGSITTKEAVTDNTHVYLDEGEADQYFVINNALIYEQMFKYEKVEDIITDALRGTRTVRARLM